MINQKEIQYLNKDFNSLKLKLINFTKTYFPDTYNDFSEASPGMMLIELSAYVGDILSLYLDNQIQENFVQFSKQRKNLLAHAYNSGYKPQVTAASTVLLDIYQILPSVNVSGTILPDFNYALIIEEGAQVQSSIDPSLNFIIGSKIEFNKSGSYDPTDISVYSLDGNGDPNFYLLKKQARANSGTIKTVPFEFGNPQRFPTITLSDNNIITILDVIDSNNNKWYEVPYLAQETIFEARENTTLNEPNLSQFKDTVPYILKLKKIPRRFVSRFKTNNSLEIQFGSGMLSSPDEEIVPNPNNVGLGLPYGINRLYTAYDPSNFLYTKTYGVAPYNTTLNVRYIVGGGVKSNVPSNTINLLSVSSITFNGTDLDNTLSNTIINSLTINNEEPAIGGGDGDSNNDLMLNSLASYPTQLRAVTNADYIIRTLSLPSKFGIISKAYEDNDIFLRNQSIDKYNNNQNSLSIYILSKDINNNLAVANDAIKQNLKTYLSEFRMLTDSVNIKDAFIINIGINFDIIIRPNNNNKIVLNRCLTALQDYFNTDLWSINQPIILSDIYTLLDKVEGVQTVKNIEIENKSGTNSGYSKYGYDIKSATVNGIIYPSLDPSIFEIKYPLNDIKGRSTVL